MSEVAGDERYTFTGEKTVHKVDGDGEPDLNGAEYHVIEELSDGYTVYIKPVDPSQPNPNYFIHKRYFV